MRSAAASARLGAAAVRLGLLTEAEYAVLDAAARAEAVRERQKRNMARYREREAEREKPPAPSKRQDVPGEWIDDDGIVLPRWRAEVARRRAAFLAMAPIAVVVDAAYARNRS